MIGPTGTALAFVVTKMGVVFNEGLESLIQLSRYSDVLNAVALHLTLSSLIALKHRPPKVKAFVLDLCTNLKERGDVGKLVHDKPKPLDNL